MILEKRLRCFDPLFIQRQKVLSAAAFEGSFASASVCQKIFERNKHKRTEPALRAIDSGVNLTFDQISEKTLGEILRIVHSVTAAAHETVERRPISLAKLCECDSGKSPVRSLLSPPRQSRSSGWRKQIALTTLVPDHALHFSGLYQDRRKKARADDISNNCVQHALRNPFVKGK